jgi:surface protein
MNMGIIAASRLRASAIRPFIIEVDTTKAGTPSDQFQFTGAEGDYDVVAKQNDIVVATFNDLSGAETITLPSSGVYDLEVIPKEVNGFNRIEFNNRGDKDKIIDTKQFGGIVWSSFEKAFSGCQEMLFTATDVPNLSNVTNMSFMFFTARAANPDATLWDVSNVTNMGSIFQAANAFNRNINNWNVSNVTNMNRMFSQANAFNQPLNNWNVSNVTDMGRMFAFGTPTFNQDLSGWCVEQIPTKPTSFDVGADAWTLPNSRPIWGTCP